MIVAYNIHVSRFLKTGCRPYQFIDKHFFLMLEALKASCFLMLGFFANFQVTLNNSICDSGSNRGIYLVILFIYYEI